jgi:glutathione S-transferase
LKSQAQSDAAAALSMPLEAYRQFFLQGSRFIGGDEPSIADIRLAATLEFLRAIDYEFPSWASDYMESIEATLADAYSDPAADVRGFIASARGLLDRCPRSSICIRRPTRRGRLTARR